MEYSFDIFNNTPERLVKILAGNCRKIRLAKGWSRRNLSERTGVPEPTIERFETQAKISLESFARLVVAFGYFDEASALLKEAKYTTGAQLEDINRNISMGRKKGR